METLTKDFSTGAIVWYNFKSPCNILYLYSGRQGDDRGQMLFYGRAYGYA